MTEVSLTFYGIVKCVNYTKNKNTDDVIACRFLLHSTDNRLVENQKTNALVLIEFNFSQSDLIV